MRKLLLSALILALTIPLGAEAAVKTKAKSKVKTAAKKDYNCADFATQAAAQKFFIAEGGPKYDPHRLDADKDGIACEKNR